MDIFTNKKICNAFQWALSPLVWKFLAVSRSVLHAAAVSIYLMQALCQTSCVGPPFRSGLQPRGSWYRSFARALTRCRVGLCAKCISWFQKIIVLLIIALRNCSCRSSSSNSTKNNSRLHSSILMS